MRRFYFSELARFATVEWLKSLRRFSSILGRQILIATSIGLFSTFASLAATLSDSTLSFRRTVFVCTVVSSRCVHENLNNVGFIVPDLRNVATKIFNLDQKFCYVVRCPIKYITIIDLSPNIEKFLTFSNHLEFIGRNSESAALHAGVWPDEQFWPARRDGEFVGGWNVVVFEIPSEERADFSGGGIPRILPIEVGGPPYRSIVAQVRQIEYSINCNESALQLTQPVFGDLCRTISRFGGAFSRVDSPFGRNKQRNGRDNKETVEKYQEPIGNVIVPLSFIFSFVVLIACIVVNNYNIILALPLFGFGWLFVFIWWGLLK